MRFVPIALLLVCATARAEPAEKPHKSLRTALGWSLGVTAVGVATGIAATRTSDPGAQSALVAFSGMSLLVGPSIGRVYTGHYVTAGVVVRVLGFGAFVMGQAMECLPMGGSPNASGTCRSRLGLDGPAYLGAGIMALGAAWDLASIPGDVDDYNAHVALTPTVLRTPNGIGPGLALAGQF